MVIEEGVVACKAYSADPSLLRPLSLSRFQQMGNDNTVQWENQNMDLDLEPFPMETSLDESERDRRGRDTSSILPPPSLNLEESDKIKEGERGSALHRVQARGMCVYACLGRAEVQSRNGVLSSTVP